MKNLLLLCFAVFYTTFSLAQTIDNPFFAKADTIFKRFTDKGMVNYMELKQSEEFDEIIKMVASSKYDHLPESEQKAYLINAYNLLVMNEVIQNYPVGSVQDVSGFFDRNKITIAGEEMTLNQLEKDLIFKQFKDARLHFVLVCGALDCPPITDFAYTGKELEKQLNSQTTAALDDKNFLRTENSKVAISQIFRWYVVDFGNSNAGIISFINEHRTKPVNENVNLTYYDYDWTLNATSTGGSTSTIPLNANRYIVSSTIPEGQIELKLFNNLYSQQVQGSRATFFTTSASFLYGFKKRLNIGFNTRYRRVLNQGLPSSPFDVITNSSTGQFRQGITAFGPQIRWAAIPRWSNFSIQSSFVFPIGSNLSGSQEEIYIDWQGPSFYNQFFNDRAIGTRFSLFTDIGLNWEDIGRLSNGRINQVSTPLTAILSYNPTMKWIIYGLGGFTPYYRIPFDYFLQGGLGSKYQFTPNFELELLYTGFTNKFLIQNDGGANTYNLGLRINI